MEVVCNLLFAILTVVITVLNGYIFLYEVFHYLYSLPAHPSAPQGLSFTSVFTEMHFNVPNLKLV